MENKRFYSRKNYENNYEYFGKLNNIDKSKNWLYQNYIGGYYTSKNNRNNLFLSTPNKYYLRALIFELQVDGSS